MTQSSTVLKPVPNGIIRVYPKGYMIYVEGQKSACAYRLQTGKVFLFHEAADPRNMTGFAVVSAGETFGEEFLTGAVRCTAAKALGAVEVEVLSMSVETRAQIKEDSDARMQFLQRLWLAETSTARVRLILGRYPEYPEYLERRLRQRVSASELKGEVMAALAGLSREMFSRIKNVIEAEPKK
jgi:CRP-like cAMP-binding protein